MRTISKSPTGYRTAGRMVYDIKRLWKLENLNQYVAKQGQYFPKNKSFSLSTVFG